MFMEISVTVFTQLFAVTHVKIETQTHFIRVIFQSDMSDILYVTKFPGLRWQYLAANNEIHSSRGKNCSRRVKGLSH